MEAIRNGVDPKEAYEKNIEHTEDLMKL